MRSQFRERPAVTLADFQTEVKRVLDDAGDFIAKIIPRVTVGATETAIAHGMRGVPKGWRVLSPEGPCNVYQTRAPDTRYLYLANGQPAVTDPWAATEHRRLLALTGINESRGSFVWDGFHAPGKAGAGTTDFGERWDVVRVSHRTAGGTVWRNGVAVIEQAGGIWTDNYIMWKGPGLIQDDATERGAMAVRFKGHLRPAANANNNLHFGLVDESALFGGKFLLFSYDEGTDATFCFINKSGAAASLTAFPIADLFTQEHLLELVRRPENGVRVLVVYMDGDEIGRTTTNGTWTNLKPILYMNTGTVVIDDLMIVADAAFPAPDSPDAPAAGDAGSVVVSLEVL